MEEVNEVEENRDEVQETKETGKKELRAEGGTEKLSKVKETENLGELRTEVVKEEEVSKTENFESVYGGTVLDVPSKKIVLGGKVITVSFRRDINAIAGEKLSKEEIKERLITALKENAEEIIEDPPIVDPPIDDPEIEEQDKQEEKEEEKKTTKFKPKYLIPILIPLLLLILVNSCSRNNKGPVIEYENIPIDVIVYNMDNPGVLTYNDNQVKAQEGMTSNGIEGNAYDGKYYDYIEQLEIENETSTEAIKVEEIKPLINGYMNILVDENSTKEQKYEAAKKILAIYKYVEQIYLENQPDVEQYAEETIDALEAYPDENTEAEKKVVAYNLQEFFAEFGLTESNVQVFEKMVALMEAGYDITVEYEKERDGDYQITGEAVREVVRDQDPVKAKSTWNKIVDWVKGRSDKGIEK